MILVKNIMVTYHDHSSSVVANKGQVLSFCHLLLFAAETHQCSVKTQHIAPVFVWKTYVIHT